MASSPWSWELLSTFTGCAGACHSNVVKELPPKLVQNREWYMGSDASEEEVPITAVPQFFFNKEWDLTANVAIPAVVAAVLATESHKQNNQKPIVLPTPDEHSRQRCCSFHLQQSDRFGMVLDETLEPLPGGLLVVTRLDACSTFARTAQGGCGLMAGDVIVEVNGAQGSASELRDRLRREFGASGEKTINLVVRVRPPTFNIELVREGAQWKKLGIAAVPDKSNSGCLLLQGLQPEGLFPLWNEAHGSLRICKGDLITHVNGISKDVQAMKNQVSQSSARGAKLRFRIVTPSGQASGFQKELQDVKQPETSVPWDMQVTWLDNVDDLASEVSTTYGSSPPSGARTPEDSCPSGMRTPEEPYT